MSECARVVTDKEQGTLGLITPPCHGWRFGQGLQVPEDMDKTQWVDLGHSPLHQLWHLILGFMRRRERTGCYVVPSSPGNGTPEYMRSYPQKGCGRFWSTGGKCSCC